MKNLVRFLSRAAVVAVFVLTITSGSARGAGFALIEEGVTGLGNAYAGGSASAEDATTIFFNPAGLTRLRGQEVIAVAHVIMPSAKFTNEGSTHVLQAKTGVPLLGDNGGEGGVSRGIPNFYYSNKLTDRLAAGIGINAPFGLATEYDSTWVGRYYAINSDLTTVNINPSLAYKITDRFSIGVGFSAQYAKAKLSNAIDFGTLDAVGAFKALGLAPGALKLVPQKSDGYVRLEGDHWGFGYNAGLLYEFNQDTRIGAAYRSRIKHTVKGDAEFSGVPSGLSPYPVFKNGGVQATITVPDMLAVSFFHQINPQWAVMADVTWTNWSLFNELRVKFDNPAQADSVITTNWKDSYRYSVGATYTPDKKWAWRVGVAYDETPVPDEQHRTPRIPDNNRIWTAVGLGYKISNTVGLDFGYAHLFVSDPTINKSPTGEDLTRGGLKGTYSAHVDIVSAQVTIRF